MDKRRVVITGLGAVTPLGIGAEETWRAVCEGKSAAAKITKFDPANVGTQIAAEVRDFYPERFLDQKKLRRMDLFTQYAMVAAGMAVSDAGLAVSDGNAYRTGVVLGSAVGGISTLCRNISAAMDGNQDGVSHLLVPMYIPSAAASEISIALGARGPSRCLSTACATGSHCIGDAFRIIQHGEADVMLAGAAEASIVPVLIDSLCRLKASSTRNIEPERASRPFDLGRDGFVTGEGAGVLVLEELESARMRDAPIYAELAGFGSNIDAYHATRPDHESQGRCMTSALQDAGLSPRDVDYINAHGTSTRHNDRSETMAIELALGEWSKKVLVSSTKSMIGHLWSAAGAVEAIFSVLAIRDGVVPPTINYENPDPQCALDWVPNMARRADVRVAMSNSFGFGGMNGVLVFRRLGAVAA
ncbi:MAG: beta-ketoacyl-ACP synthase II [Chloroflexota bacterium]